MQITDELADIVDVQISNEVTDFDWELVESDENKEFNPHDLKLSIY